MINHFKKFSIITLLMCFAVFEARAQLGFDYAQYDVGFGAGINKVYGDAQTQPGTPSIHFNLGYNVSPFINYVFEIQAGQLKGGDSLRTLSGRQFTNAFTSVIFRAQVQAGEVIEYSDNRLANILKNVYLSTGVGFVVNHITSISRYSIQVPGFYTPGDNNSNEILIPARIGYEFKLFNNYGQPSFKVDVGYQYNFIMGDGLDGFTAGSNKDSYSQFTLGVKFAVGEVTSYRKRIPYN